MLSVVSLSGDHVLQLNIDELRSAQPHEAAVSVIKQRIRSDRQISIYRQQLLLEERFLSEADTWEDVAQLQELQLILTDYVEDYTDQFIAAVATSFKLGGSEEPDYAPGMLPVVVRKFAILLNTIDIVILRFFENLLNQILSISDAADFLWTISDSHTYNHMSPI